MKHPFTTIAGILTILGGVATFGGLWFATGQVPDGDKWAALGGALTIGAGLIKAADAAPKDPPAPPAP